jgi:hypothetical protein
LGIGNERLKEVDGKRKISFARYACGEIGEDRLRQISAGLSYFYLLEELSFEIRYS